jgi:hypothetical protein
MAGRTVEDLERTLAAFEQRHREDLEIIQRYQELLQDARLRVETAQAACANLLTDLEAYRRVCASALLPLRGQP